MRHIGEITSSKHILSPPPTPVQSPSHTSQRQSAPHCGDPPSSPPPPYSPPPVIAHPVIAASPPHSSPHRSSLKIQHLEVLVTRPFCSQPAGPAARSLSAPPECAALDSPGFRPATRNTSRQPLYASCRHRPHLTDKAPAKRGPISRPGRRQKRSSRRGGRISKNREVSFE